VALMPVADALSAILAGATPLPQEMVALDAAHRRVLAGDVTALRTQPPQAMSAMDGYAVRSADASTAPARLKVIGEVAAGRPFDQPLRANEAVRIFTGGVVPDGADAVVTLPATAIPSSSTRRLWRAGTSARPGSIFGKATCCCAPAAASPTATSRWRQA
jgi:molybdopterin molybdotransferase